MCAPAATKAIRAAEALSRSSRSTPSVTSRPRLPGTSPLRSTVCATSAGKAGSASCIGLTLTASRSGPPSRHLERLLPNPAEPRGELQRVVLPVDAGRDHHERVTVEARDGLPGAQLSRETGADRAQQLVARAVPERVVHVLEVVEVEEH